MSYPCQDGLARRLVPLFALCLAATACHEPSQEAAAAAAEPTASVQVIPLEEGSLTETLLAYGSVVPAPSSLRTFAVPFESVVRDMVVSEGQEVRAGDTLVVVEPSAEARRAVQGADISLRAEQELLKDARQRFELRLITRDELTQREQAAEDARSERERLESWHSAHTLRSPANGIVTRVPQEEGAIVAAGVPLVGVVLQELFEVRLGVEPEDVALLRPGQAVSISVVGRDPDTAVKGRTRSVARQVSSETHLVEVMVEPESTAGLLLNGFVVAEIAVSTAHGLVVPRAAILPEEDHYSLFTVEQGKARKHLVTLGLETEERVEVRNAGSLKAGDPVVILGNYVLADGMRVSVEPPPAAVAAPATAPPPASVPSPAEPPAASEPGR
jgi:RND family efflux transporter MFP subunit